MLKIQEAVFFTSEFFSFHKSALLLHLTLPQFATLFYRSPLMTRVTASRGGENLWSSTHHNSPLVMEILPLHTPVLCCSQRNWYRECRPVLLWSGQNATPKAPPRKDVQKYHKYPDFQSFKVIENFLPASQATTMEGIASSGASRFFSAKCQNR